jgi:hypothetical protein
MFKSTIIETGMHSVEQITAPGRVLLHVSIYPEAWMEATRNPQSRPQ